MEKFIVYWVLSITIPTACPDYKPDEYGRMPSVHCSVYHFRIENIQKNEIFNSKEDAEAFIAQGKIDSAMTFWGDTAGNFRLEKHNK